MRPTFLVFYWDRRIKHPEELIARRWLRLVNKKILTLTTFEEELLLASSEWPTLLFVGAGLDLSSLLE